MKKTGYFLLFYTLIFSVPSFTEEFEILPMTDKTEVQELPEFDFESIKQDLSSSVSFSKSEKTKKTKEQKWSIFTGLLIHDAPFQYISTFQSNYYARYRKPWYVNLQSAMGVVLGASYDLQISQHTLFRVQGQLETTGWIAGILDLGFGIRLPSSKKNRFNMELYLSVLQTGDTLIHEDNKNSDYPKELSLYLTMFGVKVRVAYDFPVKDKYIISIYASYAAYPWMVCSINDFVSVNRDSIGNIVDSMQIGLEVGHKF